MLVLYECGIRESLLFFQWSTIEIADVMGQNWLTLNLNNLRAVILHPFVNLLWLIFCLDVRFDDP